MRDSKRIHVYRVIGWGGALIPPLAGLLVDPDNFITTVETTQPGDAKSSTEPALCWINMASDLKWVFLVPVFMSVLVGIAAVAVIVREIRRSSSHESFRSATYTAKIVLSMSAVTGVIWITAAMIIATEHVAFSYLFAITVTLQGAAIFYFHVGFICGLDYVQPLPHSVLIPM